MKIKTQNKTLRRIRTRNKIVSVASRPRLSVYRSNKYMYAQLIDDKAGKTVTTARGTKAVDVGKEISQKAVAQGIVKVVFDRGGYAYHGNVKKLADAAREGGLEF